MTPDLREPWILKETVRTYTIYNRDRDVVAELPRSTNAEPDILLQERFLALMLSQAPTMYRGANAGSDALLKMSHDLMDQGASDSLVTTIAYIAGLIKGTAIVIDPKEGGQHG